MNAFERLELIRVVLPAIEREFPFQIFSFFSFFFHQRHPILDMEPPRAHRDTQVFDGEAAYLTIE